MRYVASEWRATAAAFARCCKSFEDPVLDALWETQDQGLNPLLVSLPEGVLDSTRNVGVSITFVLYSFNYPHPVFQKTPDGVGMGSVPGIRSKNIALTPYLHKFSGYCFRVFCEPLLPNLKSLKLTNVAEDLVPFIPLFVSPRITSIYLAFELDSPQWWTLQ